MIRVWRDGAPADLPVGVPPDHPLVRWGEGLFETLRAERGRAPFADAHLDRLAASLSALAVDDPPRREDLETALAAALAAADGGPARLRLTAAAGRLVIAETTPGSPIRGEPAALSGAVLRGEWAPGRTVGEHKTVSYLGYRDAARRAVLAGADVALLTDSHGRMGEADRGNVIATVDGQAITPPARGILPGVARAWALGRGGVSEGPIPEAERQRAGEIIVCNAVEGFAAVTTLDGLPVGDGRAGPWARATQAAFAALFAAGA